MKTNHQRSYSATTVLRNQQSKGWKEATKRKRRRNEKLVLFSTNHGEEVFENDCVLTPRAYYELA